MVLLGVFYVGLTGNSMCAAGQNAAPQTPDTGTKATVPGPLPGAVVVGEAEAKKLLVLMDADKSGKVSRAEFMAFMAAEFDRLDRNHDGELDVKELEQSQLATPRHGGGHR